MRAPHHQENEEGTPDGEDDAPQHRFRNGGWNHLQDFSIIGASGVEGIVGRATPGTHVARRPLKGSRFRPAGFPLLLWTRA